MPRCGRMASQLARGRYSRTSVAVSTSTASSYSSAVDAAPSSRPLAPPRSHASVSPASADDASPPGGSLPWPAARRPSTPPIRQMASMPSVTSSALSLCSLCSAPRDPAAMSPREAMMREWVADSSVASDNQTKAERPRTKHDGTIPESSGTRAMGCPAARPSGRRAECKAV
eukprot:scaffold6218_cov119-Isochrysis_galbana.AAC.2